MRRRIAAVAVALLAAAAFALGLARGSDSGQSASVGASPSKNLSVGQLAGQRVIAGMDGTAIPPALRRLIRSGRVAGVILFADNFPSRAAGRALVDRLQGIPRPQPAPLLILADQEGGLVKRISGPPDGSAREMSSGTVASIRREGRRTAANLLDVGVNVNLAPVLDVARPGSALTETAREWGSRPARVSAKAMPFALAMQNGGVVATAKHFPGLGAVGGNTDTEVERIDLSRAELRRVDMAPFARFAAAGGEMIMLSTAIYPAFSPRPAAFSAEIATGELRDRVGFEGVSITDALDSVSALQFGEPAQTGLAAVRAGVDLLLYTDPASAARAHLALARALRAGSLSAVSFDAAADRVLSLRGRLRD